MAARAPPAPWRRPRSLSASRSCSSGRWPRSPVASCSASRLAAALVAGPRLLLLDEPTSQLDPVAGEELLSQLRRLNEEWGTTVLIGEHRLERCLAAADRVIALDRGRVACDDSPDRFLEWAARHRPELVPPAARMFSLAGLQPLPVTVKEARSVLRARGVAVPTGEQAVPARRRAGARGGAVAERRLGGVRRWNRGPARAAARRRLRAKPSRCWGATAPGRARCCAPRRGWSRPRAGGSAPAVKSRCCCRRPGTTCCTSASWTSCRRGAPRRCCTSWV